MDNHWYVGNSSWSNVPQIDNIQRSSIGFSKEVSIGRRKEKSHKGWSVKIKFNVKYKFK